MDRRLILCTRALIETLEARFLMDGTLDIADVQPAALDQPRIHIFLRRNPGDDPLIADDGFGDTSFDIQAFLDTGSSGSILSQETYTGLGITNEQATDGSGDVFYFDTGIGGDNGFNVSEPLYGAIAPFSPVVDGTDPAQFNTNVGPFRYETNPTPVDDPDLEEPLDIIGMPAIDGKVMVMDPKPVDGIDYMNTYLYPPGTPYNAGTADTDPGIPPTTYHVQTSRGNFDRFTLIDPPDAERPTTTGNPMIGPDPVSMLEGNPPDDTPPISIGMGGLSTTGSFLFDTGAAASFISQSIAGQVGVFYKDGTYNSDNPDLVDSSGQDIPNQFALQIGGTGGTINVAGFFLDSMTLQTQEGVSIRFLGAPVLVADITVEDPNTGDQLTLDGDFGVNYLVASVSIVQGSDGSADFGDIRNGPFSWVTYDSTTGLIGLEPAPDGGGGGGGGSGSEILDRQIFYNNSVFDGFNPGVNNGFGGLTDDRSIATDKQALLPGQTATFSNYTSYTKGINGIMIDMFLDPDATAITASDFEFRVGNDSNPGQWTLLTDPAQLPTVTGRPGEGEIPFFIDRIELTWPDGTITGEWLQVKVLADDNTGLSAPDVFYFGNAPAESGNSTDDAAVNVADMLAARGRMSVSPAQITDAWDYNRDGFINTSDVLAARGSLSSGRTDLSLIDAPIGVGPGQSASPANRSAMLASRMTMAPAFGSLTQASSMTQPSALVTSTTGLAADPAAAPLLQTAAKVLAVTAPPPVQFVQTTSLPPNSHRVGDLVSAVVVTASALHPGSPDSPPHKAGRLHHAAGKRAPTPFSNVRVKVAPAIDLQVA
ncbi:MAG TPA: hypothetical protein VH370_01870 [Humisphaera sp.]|jgi:hypothetical protein|nr:hypothetical protein [Humisphaera sp.]